MIQTEEKVSCLIVLPVGLFVTVFVLVMWGVWNLALVSIASGVSAILCMVMLFVFHFMKVKEMGVWALISYACLIACGVSSVILAPHLIQWQIDSLKNFYSHKY